MRGDLRASWGGSVSRRAGGHPAGAGGGAATRHGRSSTTLVVAAPVLARAHLVRCMRDAAERAFGEQVDVDGLVDQNGDVLVRLTWDRCRPVAGHLLEGVGGPGTSSAWPAPCLVPAVVL